MSTPSRYEAILGRDTMYDVPRWQQLIAGLSLATTLVVTGIGVGRDNSNESPTPTATPIIETINTEAAPQAAPVPGATPTPATDIIAFSVNTETAAMPSPSPNPH